MFQHVSEYLSFKFYRSLINQPVINDHNPLFEIFLSFILNFASELLVYYEYCLLASVF